MPGPGDYRKKQISSVRKRYCEEPLTGPVLARRAKTGLVLSFELISFSGTSNDCPMKRAIWSGLMSKIFSNYRCGKGTDFFCQWYLIMIPEFSMASCHMTMPDRSIGVIAESDRGCSVLGAWYIPPCKRKNKPHLIDAVRASRRHSKSKIINNNTLRK